MKDQVRELYKKVYGTDFPYDFTDLDNQEKKMKYFKIMDELGLSTLKPLRFVHTETREDRLARLMMKQTNCIVRVYMLDGYDMA